jgi:hypothetical protein
MKNFRFVVELSFDAETDQAAYKYIKRAVFDIDTGVSHDVLRVDSAKLVGEIKEIAGEDYLFTVIPESEPEPLVVNPARPSEPTLGELEAAHRLEYKCAHCGKPGGH